MSSKPRPVFAEMPWNIKQDIIDATDFRTRCSLRKCSRFLRSQVNNSNAFLLPMAFVLGDHSVRVTWTNDDNTDIVIYYRSEADGCSVNGKFIYGENYIDRSVADFAAVTKHSKTLVDDVLVIDDLRTSKLRTRETEKMLRVFEKEFASYPLRVQNLQCYLIVSQHDQLRMLALCRPETLKMIGLESIKWQDTNELIASEHWRRAREVELIGFRNVPAQSLVHFHKWYLKEIRITEEDAKVFVEKIFEHGESFREWDSSSAQLIPEAFNYFISNFDHHVERDMLNGVDWGLKSVFLKKMPGTMYHLKIEIKIFQYDSSVKFSKVLSSEVEQ